MPYNFGCRALYKLPWQASVSSQLVIRFNATYLLLRRYCEKYEPLSWTMQKVQQRRVARFDAVRLFIFVLIRWTLQPHFTLQLSAWTLQCLFEGVCMPQYFCTLPGLDQGWTQGPTLDVVLYQVLWVSEQYSWKSLCNPVALPRNSSLVVLLRLFLSICIVQTVCLYSMDFMFVAKTLKWKALNKFTKKYIRFYNPFKVRGVWSKEIFFKGGVVEKRLRTTVLRSRSRKILEMVASWKFCKGQSWCKS